MVGILYREVDINNELEFPVLRAAQDGSVQTFHTLVSKIMFWYLNQYSFWFSVLQVPKYNWDVQTKAAVHQEVCAAT